MEILTKKCFIECSVQCEEDHVHDPQPSEEEDGIIPDPFPFADDDVLNNVSNLEDEDQYDQYIDVESETQ